MKFCLCFATSSKNINILTASDYGYLVICLPENSQMLFSPAPFIHKMRKNLQDFKETDYILCTGDPAIIGLSTAIVSDITQGRFNLLNGIDRRQDIIHLVLIYLRKE